MTTREKHNDDVSITSVSVSAPVERSTAPKVTSYKEHRELLRWDFWYACAFCTLTECEASAVAFQIDHYLPRARYPELELEYRNLFWACSHCNGRKSDHPPKAAAQKGFRFLKVDVDDPNDHLCVSELSPTRLEAKTTEVGEYTLEQLYLNRKALREIRELRSRLYRSRETLVNGLRALDGLALEQLPRQSRGKFTSIRRRLKTQGKQTSDFVDSRLLREASKSVFIDPNEPGHDAERRKEFLRQVKAPVMALDSDPV